MHNSIKLPTSIFSTEDDMCVHIISYIVCPLILIWIYFLPPLSLILIT